MGLKYRTGMKPDPRLLASQNIEVWEPVPHTPYQASNLGRLRNPKTGNLVGTCLLKNGYLSLPGILAHRAILSAFDGSQPPGVVVRHKDGNRSNNMLTNLSWGTRAENAADTAAAGRLRSRSGAVSVLDVAKADSVFALLLEKRVTQREAASTLNRSEAWVSVELRKRTAGVTSVRSRAWTVEEARLLCQNRTEVWVPAVGASGREVSNFGRVRNSKTKKVQSVCSEKRSGYVKTPDGPFLHRVVLYSFDDPPFDGALIRHTPDPDRTNNALTNLQWGTYKDNGEDTRKDGRTLTGEKHPRATMSDAKVEEGLRAFEAEGWTTAQLGEFLGVGQGNAVNIVNGHSWAHVSRPESLQHREDQRKGGCHYLSNLTDERVAEALQLAADNGWGAPKFAKHLGISTPTGTQILSGKTWRHIPRPDNLSQRRRVTTKPEDSPTSLLETLTARVREKMALISGGFKLSSENECLLTRNELILATEETSPAAVEAQLLPVVVAFFQAYVQQHGWFYPECAEKLPNVLSELSRTPAEAKLTSRTRTGNAFLQARFRSFWDVSGGSVERFAKGNLLLNVVKYRLGLNTSKLYAYTLPDGRKVETRETFDINIKNIRRGFTVQHSGVSFFKPQTATTIYKYFLKEGAPVVWDPSSGFGARLLGFAAAFPRGKYYGNEPATATRRDLIALGAELNQMDVLSSVHISPEGSEGKQSFDDSTLDFVFTSPPYFDLEKYCDEPSQCWNKYPTADLWYQGYLLPTMREVFRGLKPGREAVFNVDERRKPAVLQAAAEAGLEFSAELRMLLGTDHFSRSRGQADDERSEPVLVLRKPSKK
jgi:hypothetical protein